MAKTNKQGQPKKRRKLDIWNRIAVVVLTCFLVGCISVFFILVNVINDPEGMRFSEDGLTTLSNSRVYDYKGDLMYEFGDEIREDITYDQIPQNVIDAFLSIEDSRFFDHNGFDLPRFISAALNNLRSGDFSQGGSTLTMQMIDNAFTKNQEEKMISEKGGVSKLDQVKLKIQEIYLSLIAEQSIGKEEIFEYYVNRIWFGSGNNTRGIQKAAEYFFGKDISQINLSEAAFLAGCINAPGQYNPLANMYDTEVDHLELAENRRDVTLQLMLQHGYITENEYKLASNTDLSFALNYKETSSVDSNEAAVDQAIAETIAVTGQDPSIIPMDIYTSINQAVQKQADEICNGNVVSFPRDEFDIGFSVIENKTGEIIAVGPGRRYHTDAVKIDNSTDRKQPGSSMKPLLAYSSTFDLLGWSTEHTVDDKADDYFNTGSNLNNSDGKYNGKMSLKDALGVSKNCPAAAAMCDLVDETGYDYWIDFCKKLGYDEDVYENFNEQYSIGGSNMFASPIQQASAYTIFANGGKRINPHIVRKVIRRSDNQEVEGNKEEYELISEEAAFMTSYLLKSVVNGGYSNLNNILSTPNYTAYGKSGTSDWGTDGVKYGIPVGTFKDEWSLGYTDDITVAVWSGFTAKYQAMGCYFSYSELIQGTAFHISHNLLDFCQDYYDYKDIAVPDGVSNYQGGYIKTEYLSKGDNTSVEKEPSEEEKACLADGGEWDEESETCTIEEEPEEPETPENSGTEGGTETPVDPGTGGGEAPVDPGTGGEENPENPGQIAGMFMIDPRKFLLGFRNLINLI
ncbi:transglycosylase domain-containing protein [Floccifex sp.]|uniref:transglycosylase domain-containing protein n=1 Tax=Floccifex sp. TaxID=2815810 RepID=UPI002A75E8CC|nr:transglycosylase domain-containing protein [Floccifex sp.]MDD7281718.1 transglycosylase domain-containing protein [Erysipelotrichaceae bacterium]MDY2957468.1 transglycosylase domain-containing protein [Floccifex sp.]